MRRGWRSRRGSRWCWWWWRRRCWAMRCRRRGRGGRLVEVVSWQVGAALQAAMVMVGGGGGGGDGLAGRAGRDGGDGRDGRDGREGRDGRDGTVPYSGAFRNRARPARDCIPVRTI